MQFRQSTHLLTENIIYSYSDGRKARMKLAENLFHNMKSHSSWFRLPPLYSCKIKILVKSLLTEN